MQPNMHAGSPATFERTKAFVENMGEALDIATGRPSPISKFHELLHPPTSGELRTEAHRAPGDQDPLASTDCTLHRSRCAHSTRRPRPGPGALQ